MNDSIVYWLSILTTVLILGGVWLYITEKWVRIKALLSVQNRIIESSRLSSSEEDILDDSAKLLKDTKVEYKATSVDLEKGKEDKNGN